MKILVTFFICWTISHTTSAQSLYFPPLVGNQWDTISPNTMGYCPSQVDSLYDYLENTDSKAFILLKDGKIVLEKYFGTFTKDSTWYWASAGKSLTAYLVGIAQQENLLQINDTSSRYLGNGWTNCTPTQESAITIRHQLAMTTGLDDNAADFDCTLDTCLQYLAPTGSRWAYHNGPYTLLDQVVENASGLAINTYFTRKIRLQTGITGLYVPIGYNKVFFSTPRSMARFGLLTLNEGNWNGTPILSDTTYFDEMTTSAQSINPSYGYLWWLNGKATHMLPRIQLNFNGSIVPNAPNDAIMALGKNGQMIHIIPSQNLVWIRMGDSPNNSLVPNIYANSIWEKINQLNCTPLSIDNINQNKEAIALYPIPSQQGQPIQIQTKEVIEQIEIYTPAGQLLEQQKGNTNTISTINIPKGLYLVRIHLSNQTISTKKMILQ